MFKPEDITRIRALLSEGLTAEQVAKAMNLPLSTFRLYLANSGYRVAVRRELEAIEAVEPALSEPETVAS